ncbi:hypothetical protein [Acinetobacter sp. P1(2025)]|uniref:hypothetical protein n=1 Tax=Acinetobacter sp. P1(2025) TaxID=3446120 RepID=UPI003F530C8D
MIINQSFIFIKKSNNDYLVLVMDYPTSLGKVLNHLADNNLFKKDDLNVADLNPDFPDQIRLTTASFSELPSFYENVTNINHPTQDYDELTHTHTFDYLIVDAYASTVTHVADFDLNDFDGDGSLPQDTTDLETYIKNNKASLARLAEIEREKAERLELQRSSELPF